MKSAKKIRCAAAALATLMCIAGSGAHSAMAANARNATPEITLNGYRYEGDARIINGRTYVKVREFSENLGARVNWDGTSKKARVVSNGIDLTVGCTEDFFTSNGQYLKLYGESFVESERIYVPLRSIAAVFGYNTVWNENLYRAELSTTQTGISQPSYSKDDLYWLSRIISAEAEGESYYGKLAVGAVVLNRVKSREFPNTVYGVIFDRKNGTQFTPVANGEIYGTPDAESIRAAKACLEGNIVSGDILFFMNKALAESFWISSSRSYVMTIGNHDFYS